MKSSAKNMQVVSVRLGQEELKILEKIQKEVNANRSEALRLCIHLVDMFFINKDLRLGEVIRPLAEIFEVRRSTRH